MQSNSKAWTVLIAVNTVIVFTFGILLGSKQEHPHMSALVKIASLVGRSIETTTSSINQALKKHMQSGHILHSLDNTAIKERRFGIGSVCEVTHYQQVCANVDR